MASAQQKPKATSADKRNPNRRNGKASKKVSEKKYPGKTIMGHKREKFYAMCEKAGLNPNSPKDLELFTARMKESRRVNRRTAAEKRADQRRAIARAVNVGMK